MNTQSHARAKEIFLGAVGLASAERGPYVMDACGGDTRLREEVESLLAHHDSRTILPETSDPVAVPRSGSDSPQILAAPPPVDVVVNRGGGIGGTVFSRLFGDRKRRVIAAVAACLLLLAAELVVYQLVQWAMRQQLANELAALLAADVEALRTWIRWQESTALTAAADQPFVDRCQRLVELAAASDDMTAALFASSDLRQLRDEIKPLLETHGYLGFVVVDSRRRIVASNEDALIGESRLIQKAGEIEKFFGEEAGPAVLQPFPAVVPLLDVDGRLRPGVPTMFVAAPLRDRDGKVFAVLGLRIPPDEDFTRILNVAQAGATGETYAFDRSGVLLSESRFGEQLQEIGLLSSRPPVRSLLQVELRDPGVDLTRGHHSRLLRSNQPLTRLAAEATAGRGGVDVSGFRDYRGVVVVGAWTWLAKEQFGVGTQINASEAFAPLRYLQVTIAGIMIALGLVVAISMYSSFIVANLRRQVQSLHQVGPYQLEQQIGEGGMGQVFLARHNLLKRPTAIKLLKDDMTGDRDLARFEREVQLASRLTHPHTIEVYDFGRTPDGVFYCAMEFLPGLTLAQLVSQCGALPAARAVYILRQVCQSLREAHQLGLIHRDVKPQNIMLTERGGEWDFVKVLDFGLAKEVREDEAQKITQEMKILGTPLYIAPEILRGAVQLDARVDVYAVGVVAFLLLTGTEPFQGSNLVELFQQVLNVPPPGLSRDGLPAIPARLEQLVLNCMAKAPDRRPPDMEAILAVLNSDLGLTPWTQKDACEWWRTRREGFG